jgi:energy-coupling factor transporter ATP-binding protein EcfA2
MVAPTVAVLSLDERQALIDTFTRTKIRHAKLSAVEIRLLSVIRVPASANFIFFYGPSGVGKSTLLALIVATLERDDAEAMAGNPSYMPVICFAAPASNIQFDWVEFYTKGLKELHEPVATPKANRLKSRKLTNNEAREDFIAALGTHGTKVVIVDEADHIKSGVSDSRLHMQLNVFKSISAETGALFVFAGTYETLKLRNLNAQLGRRSRDVHFARYTDGVDDYADYRDSLAKLLARLPVEIADDLLAEIETLYLRTCGLVGTLKDSLTRAMSEALQEGSPLRWEHVEREIPPRAAAVVAAIALSEAEEQLAEDIGLELELRRHLGFGLSAADRAVVNEATTPIDDLPEQEAKGKRRPAVGRRKARLERREVPA